MDQSSEAKVTVIEGEQKEARGYFDFSLLILTLVVIAFGVVMIYSASSYNATKYYSDPMYFTRSQIRNVVLSVVIMIALALFDYRFYAKGAFSLSYLALIGVTLLMVVVTFFGKDHNGSTRWLEIAGFSFQPSEVAKVGVIMFVAFAISRAPGKLNKWTGFMKILVFCLPLLGMVALENLSSAIIIAAIIFVTCFIASEKKLYYVFFVLAAVGAAAVMVFAVGYRSDRIDIWLNVETHEKAGQILQGLYAIASAGFFGRGLGNSLQKMGHIPEAHNDMLFSIICEELGVIGAIAVLLFYCILLWRIYYVAMNADDLYGSMLCTGVFVNIAVQVILNVAVVTNTIPSTGVALPFVSYGGTSMMVFCAEIGLVLSVSLRTKRIRVEG
ncbi:MAG: cell division protein FtsW [Lachnospiraceae bacterium]|nr:cell division protein FtsW [Lachnospiraceae bacterium]